MLFDPQPVPHILPFAPIGERRKLWANYVVKTSPEDATLAMFGLKYSRYKWLETCQNVCTFVSRPSDVNVYVDFGFK